jgi:NAD(P)H-hydrate epimerase
MRIVTSEQMRAADRHAIDEIGIPSLVLMENAGAAVVEALAALVGGEDAVHGLGVVVLCGTGNNGGDGMVVARRLAGAGAEVRVALLGDEEELAPDARVQWGILERLEIAVATIADAEDWDEVAATLEDADVIVDALLGTGFRGTLEELLARAVEDVNGCSAPVLAIDVPSGLSGSSGTVAGPAVEAAMTVTFQAAKTCHVFPPASDHCGDLIIADIGIPETSMEAAGSTLELVEPGLVADLVGELAERDESTHKGTWGHAVVVGGAIGRTGAPSLAALGALVSGAGLVTVATPAPCVPMVAATAPELMQIALPADASGAVADESADLEAILERATVLVIGPGLGTGDGAEGLLRGLLGEARVPVVLDADALNLLARTGLPEPRADRPLVLTPHPGEFARLVGGAAASARTQAERLPLAQALADRSGAVVVLKGFRTIVALPEGEAFVIPTGNPGMGTAGTGDVLAGFIGGLLAQGLPPSGAAVAAAYLHGLAGDLAAEVVGQMALRATDLLRWWPRAIEAVLKGDHDDDDEGGDEHAR